MRLSVGPDSDLVLSEVFNSITFKSADDEKLSICMRDTGFEFNYADTWYEAKQGKVNPLGDRTPDLNELKREAAVLMQCKPEDIEWSSWPQIFASTGGPWGRGGATMTTFQVWAFEAPCVTKERVKFCSGRWIRWNGILGERWPG